MKRGRKKISIRSTRMTWTYAPWNFSKKRWKGAFNVSSPFLLHFYTLRVSSKVSVINVHSHLWFCFILFPLLQLFTCQRLTFTIEESSLVGVLNRANINFTICVFNLAKKLLKKILTFPTFMITLSLHEFSLLHIVLIFKNHYIDFFTFITFLLCRIESRKGCKGPWNISEVSGTYKVCFMGGW